ncbi:hypothetical protein SARC_04625, partial [Sphaeroforma arctica JP610]
MTTLTDDVLSDTSSDDLTDASVGIRQQTAAMVRMVIGDFRRFVDAFVDKIGPMVAVETKALTAVLLHPNNLWTVREHNIGLTINDTTALLNNNAVTHGTPEEYALCMEIMAISKLMLQPIALADAQQRTAYRKICKFYFLADGAPFELPVIQTTMNNNAVADILVALLTQIDDTSVQLAAFQLAVALLEGVGTRTSSSVEKQTVCDDFRGQVAVQTSFLHRLRLPSSTPLFELIHTLLNDHATTVLTTQLNTARQNTKREGSTRDNSPAPAPQDKDQEGQDKGKGSDKEGRDAAQGDQKNQDTNNAASDHTALALAVSPWPTWTHSSTSSHTHTPPPDREMQMILTVLRFIQLLCENARSDLQDIMRIQPDSLVSYNLVTDVMAYMRRICGNTASSLFERLDRPLAEVVNQCLVALTKCCQGPCPENQVRV